MENNYGQQPTLQTQTIQPMQVQIVDDKTPISTLGFIGYLLLFCIPCVGFICELIFAFSAKNLNVKNFSRAILILQLISIVLIIAIYVFVFLIFGLALYSTSSSYFIGL